MNIFDLFKPEVIAAYWKETVSNRIPYLGEILFPNDKKSGLDLAWITGNDGLPVSLMPSAFDAKATFRDRPGMGKTETEMPFFREGAMLKEKDRQKLLMLQENSGPYVEEIIRRYLDDAARLIEGAAVARERMRMALLFPTAVAPKPGISIVANGVSYVYDYDPNSTWAAQHYIPLSGNSSWDNPATADPFTQIETLKQQINNDSGETITTLIMNTVTFNKLVKIDAIKNRFLTVNGLSVGYLSDRDIANVIKDTADLQGIIVYDKQYADENKQVHKFVPDGYVALLPDGQLGNTWRGTTPEEADLMGKAIADVSIVENGIAITQETTVNPVNVNTYASEIVLPSYERMDEVALLKVIA